MSIVRGLVRGSVITVVSVMLGLVLSSFQPAAANETLLHADNQAVLTTGTSLSSQQSGEVIWGRVPYCACLADAATANVAAALTNANLTVTLKELSPRDGWLYFVATFDANTATPDEVSDAMMVGGAELLDGPP